MKRLGQIHKKRKTKAFTLVEVIISSVIFALAMAGVYASVSQLRQPATESSQEVTAAFLGKQILDKLRTQINAQSWNMVSGNLMAGQSYTGLAATINGINYNYSYIVEDDPGGTNARKVTLNITW